MAESRRQTDQPAPNPQLAELHSNKAKLKEDLRSFDDGIDLLNVMRDGIKDLLEAQADNLRHAESVADVKRIVIMVGVIIIRYITKRLEKSLALSAVHKEIARREQALQQASATGNPDEGPIRENATVGGGDAAANDGDTVAADCSDGDTLTTGSDADPDDMTAGEQDNGGSK